MNYGNYTIDEDSNSSALKDCIHQIGILNKEPNKQLMVYKRPLETSLKWIQRLFK